MSKYEKLYGKILDKLILQQDYITDRSSIGSDEKVALFSGNRKIWEGHWQLSVNYIKTMPKKVGCIIKVK